MTAVIAGQRRAAEHRWGRGTGRLADTVAVSVGTLQGGGQVNLIPAAAMAEVERVTRGRVAVDVFNQWDPYVTPPDARLVRLVRANAREINRRTVLPVVRLGYTDGRFFRRAGIPTVVYGPAMHGMGGPDEYIETADLLDVAVVHVGAVADILVPGAA